MATYNIYEVQEVFSEEKLFTGRKLKLLIKSFKPKMMQ